MDFTKAIGNSKTHSPMYQELVTLIESKLNNKAWIDANNTLRTMSNLIEVSITVQRNVDTLTLHAVKRHFETRGWFVITDSTGRSPVFKFNKSVKDCGK